MTSNERLGLHLWLTEEMGFIVSDTKPCLTVYANVEYGYNIVVPDGREIDPYDSNHVRTFAVDMMEDRRDWAQCALAEVYA